MTRNKTTRWCYVVQYLIPQEPPFIQWKNDTPLDYPIYNLNEHLEGFCVSVLEQMAKLLDFTYNLTLVPDGKFGSLKSYGWTGMVRVLVDKVRSWSS